MDTRGRLVGRSPCLNCSSGVRFVCPGETELNWTDSHQRPEDIKSIEQMKRKVREVLRGEEEVSRGEEEKEQVPLRRTWSTTTRRRDNSTVVILHQHTTRVLSQKNTFIRLSLLMPFRLPRHLLFFLFHSIRIPPMKIPALLLLPALDNVCQWIGEEIASTYTSSLSLSLHCTGSTIQVNH